MSLCAEHISCKRNSRILFHDIHFELTAGKLLQVVGNNGAGKTSLLRIASGLLQPHSGKILWNQEPIFSSQHYHEHLFYLGHALALRDELTVKENIGSDKNLQNVLKHWKLSALVDQLCGELSQGQKQRVALARLSLSEKICWILDEPFSNLDADGVFQLEQLLQTHLNRGGMVLLSTHREIKMDAVKQDVLNIQQ